MNTHVKQLGSHGPSVFPLGLGCMAMSPVFNRKSDDAEGLATIHAALDRGVNLLDTGDFYGAGHNEMLVGRAIKDRRDQAVLSVKFGGLRGPDGAFVGLDGRPAAVKNFAAYSLQRLGVDHIDIYRLARLDPQVPIEETIGAVAELVRAGYVRHIGLSEVGPETIRRAHAVHPICDLQIEYSLMSRDPERAILPVLDELGIAVTAYGILCHGLLSGTAGQVGEGDARSHLPRFKGENFARNQRLVEALAEIGREKGATTAQLATAWVLARGLRIIPLIGARRREQLDESLGALDIALSDDDLARIEQAVPPEAVAGTRYDERLMAWLDSETGA